MQPLRCALLLSSLSLFGLLSFQTLARAATSLPPVNVCPQLANIDSWIIDLDGTIYDGKGLIPGATKFYSWLNDNSIPFVFLSNTGIKGPEGVRAKFSAPNYRISPDPVPASKIFTAAEGLANWLIKNAPAKSRFYMVTGKSVYEGQTDSFVNVLSRQAPPELFKSWIWRTDLSVNETKEWAQGSLNGDFSVFAVFAVDDRPDAITDPVTGQSVYKDWGTELFAKARYIAANGGKFLFTAPDSSNINYDNAYPDLDLLTPSIGSYAQVISYSLSPSVAREAVISVGKGTEQSVEFMVKPALELLNKQSPRDKPVDPRRTAIIGDRLDTDIAAGTRAGIPRILVLSGVHQLKDLPDYEETSRPTCILTSVGDVPDVYAAAKKAQRDAVLVKNSELSKCC